MIQNPCKTGVPEGVDVPGEEKKEKRGNGVRDLRCLKLETGVRERLVVPRMGSTLVTLDSGFF